MKKYFIHDGNKQEGPFDIDELRAMRITKDTMLWFEGLDSWTKADHLAEVRDAIGATPPPYQAAQTDQAPPEQHSKERIPTPSSARKTSTWKVIRVALIVLLVFLGLGVIVDRLNSRQPLMKLSLNPPAPRVLSTHGAQDDQSTFMDFKEGIDVTVLNDGGSGNVLVTCYLNQGDKTYDRSKEIWLGEHQSQDVHFTFDEASVWNGKMSVNATAKATE